MDEAENPIQAMADLDERREMPRCTVDVAVTLLVLTRGTMLMGRMTELSLSGCRVALPKTIAQAGHAAVECTFKIHGMGFRLLGTVEWAENNLAGFRFNAMSSRCRDDLMEVLCEVELENCSKQLAPSNTRPEMKASETAAESPEIETILREAAVLRPAQSRPESATWNPFAGMAISAPERTPPSALRPAPGPLVALAAAAAEPARSTIAISSRAAETGPSPLKESPEALNHSAKQPVRGRERRATHRCGIDTSAIIDLVKTGSQIPGQIVDLSVGGCRIKTAEKFPVGIYTRIETEFKLHGLPFRLGGVIQAIHDRNTVGIRFLDLSQRKKDQIAELVAEIEDLPGN